MSVYESAVRIEPFDDPSWDPIATMAKYQGTSIVLDPYPAVALLREQGAVHHLDIRTHLGAPSDPLMADYDVYAVLGWDALREVFDKPEVFSTSALEYTVGKMFGHVLGPMPAQEHARWRPFFMKSFLPHVIAKWGTEYVDPIIDDLISRFEKDGRAELVGQFAQHYPFLFICRQLGLARADEETYMKMAHALMCVSIDPPKAEEAKVKLGRYFKARIEECRANPGEDIVSRMATAEIDGEYLPEELIVSMLRLLLAAASDTTYRSTTNLLVGLLTNPEQLEAVRNDRSLVPAAVEEGLRWEAPVTYNQRTCEVDYELAGVKIPKGAAVDVWFGAANRDPAKFAQPEKFDVFRKKERHFTFGSGPHVCLGQHLGKLEIQRALVALLDRLPNLRLDPDYPTPQILGINGRAAFEVRVRFG